MNLSAFFLRVAVMYACITLTLMRCEVLAADEDGVSFAEKLASIARDSLDDHTSFTILNRDIQYLDGGSFGVAIESNDGFRFFLVALSRNNKLSKKSVLVVSPNEALTPIEHVLNDSVLASALYSILLRSKNAPEGKVRDHFLMIKGILWTVKSGTNDLLFKRGKNAESQIRGLK